MSWSAKCSWKPDTPGSEPAGARISAGKSGNVARSLPDTAVSEVKRPPVSCMPSPESPAKRMTTDSSCSTGFPIGLTLYSEDLKACQRGIPVGAEVVEDELPRRPPPFENVSRHPRVSRRSSLRRHDTSAASSPGALRGDHLALGADPVLEGVAALLEVDVVRARRDVAV